MRTVVIDAGHGGKDPGAISKDNKTYEKTLTLDIAGKLETKIRDSYPDVKVVMTRKDDRFVSLDDRAAIANKANADLFISIHINSTKSQTPNGYSLHTLGQSKVRNRDLLAYNMDVCVAENSVIKLEDDYTTKYEGFNPDDPESYIFMQLMQNSHLEQSLLFSEKVHESLAGGPICAGRGVWQNPFYVLWKTSMPAVLVELGFLSNPSDLTTLRSDKNRSELADRMFKAFVKYKTAFDSSFDTARNPEPAGPSTEKETPSPKQVTPKQETTEPTVREPAPKVQTPGGTVFGYQIFALSRKLPSSDPAFMGFEPTVIPAGKIYKYVIGTAPSFDAAKMNRDKIRRKYPEAFPVKIQNDVVSALR